MIIITTNIRLYKGVSIDTKEWISGFLLKKNEHYFIQQDNFSAEVYFDSLCLQVSYLKDMNQEDVYENDLLQVIDPDGSSAEIMAVCFDPLSFSYKVKVYDEEEDWGLYMDLDEFVSHTDFKVVGNICDKLANRVIDN